MNLFSKFQKNQKKTFARADGFKTCAEKKDFNELKKDIEDTLNISDIEINNKLILYVYRHDETPKSYELLFLIKRHRKNLLKELEE